MERIGIIGLPNAGKSTLFNALTGGAAPVAAHPFTTQRTNLGVAPVVDRHVDRLGEVEKSPKVIYAQVEFADMPALVEGASLGEGLGNQFLGEARTMDALCLVLRAFGDPSVPPAREPVSARADLETLQFELILADLEAVRRRRERAEKEARSDPSKNTLVAALRRAEDALDAGTRLADVEWDTAELVVLREMAPLTLKPLVAVVNITEDDDADASASDVAAVLGDDIPVVALSAKLEAETAELDTEARAEIRDALGLGEEALPLLAQAAYTALGLISFYTAGPKESRAWTVRAGATAPQAAGRIHSDLERGFIRAEVITYDDFIAHGGETGAKAKGVLRVEGKDYVVKPGDVLHIRFNV